MARRISKYVPGCDGTKLAVDIYLPETDKKVPLLMTAGYNDRRVYANYEKDVIERFVDAEYAVAVVDVRGSGASYGVSDGFYGPRDGKDLAAVIDTLAAEDWCNGNVGMYGGSNYGMSQEITAVEQPKALKACIPCDCSMDFYYQDYPNGVSSLPKNSGGNSRRETPGAPVDEDPAPEYPMLKAAKKCQERNLPFLAQHMDNMYRDDIHPYLGYYPNLDVPAWEKMDEIRFGHVNMFCLGAWFDPGCANQILSWKQWGGKLLIGPWGHTGVYRGEADYPNSEFDWCSDHIRYFDNILKEKNNGMDIEPPIRYYTIGDTQGKEWHYSADFPVEGTTYPQLFLGEEGSLSENCEKSAGAVSYKVREDVNIYEMFGRMNLNVRKNLAEEDEKSIVFTSDILSKDVEITGIPTMELWITSTHTDGNFIVCLEEVTSDGYSHYLTSGAMRASHAKLDMSSAHNALGLPYHRGLRKNAVKLNEEKPMKLFFRMEALSRIVKAGSRIRVSVSCGGSGFTQPEGFPSVMPTITVHTGKETPSNICLPVVKPTATVFEKGDIKLHVFKRGIYIEKEGRFTLYPCTYVYPVSETKRIFKTKDFDVSVEKCGLEMTARILIDSNADLNMLKGFEAKAQLEDRQIFDNASEEIPIIKYWDIGYFEDDGSYDYIKNLYVATAPVEKGVYGNGNSLMRHTFDLYVDLIRPKNKCENLPLIINIHGMGGNHHQFESTTKAFLDKGYAVASLDYRLSPPNVWKDAVDDVWACIEFLKENSRALGLDANRFGVLGGSMGGYLSAMLAAVNKDSIIKAAAVYFGFTDFLHFGEDSAEVWPNQPHKVEQSDGPFAPLGSLIGYAGNGKGLGDVKVHMYDPSEKYQALLKETVTASPISHVSENSAPTCFVHGMDDCMIQVPMGQSIRMFKALTRKGVKSLLLFNNGGFFGEDPEIKAAVIDFMSRRV